MKSWIHVLYLLIFEALSARRDVQIRFLKAQVEILRKKVPGNRVIIDPAERTRLLALGEEVAHAIKDTLLIVSFKTYKRWLLEARNGKIPKRVGRPRLTKQVCELILRMARENMRWGMCRIVGELKKLNLYAGRTSVRRVLQDHGLHPDPRRRQQRMPDSPWRHFLAVHLNTLVACDFLCQTIWTPLGKKTAYLLMFVHLESRKVFLSPATYEPNEGWVCQQARNVGMWLEDHGVTQRFIMHDHDTKFSEAFDRVFRDRKIEVVKTPVAAPDANAFAESWIGGFKRECLNHFFCFSLPHLDYIAQQAVAFYNEYRPHQSKGNEPLRFGGQPPPAQAPSEGPIACREFLGGLLKHYYRKAA